MTRLEESDRATLRRLWPVWGLLAFAAAAVGALSAFAEPAVRTAEYRYGAAGVYGLDVRVWGVRLHRERVGGTLTTVHDQALALEFQWRLGLAAATAVASAAVTAATFAAFARTRRGRRGHRRRGSDMA